MKTTRAATDALPSPPGRGVGGEGKQPLDPALLAFARQLRQQQTDAEKLLWALLRNRRLAGFKFRRQHPVRPYVLDFYCHAAGLAIELDGGQHDEPGARAHDAQRTAFLEGQGIRVLRFWNHEVLTQTGAVLQTIYDALTPALSQGAMPYPHLVAGGRSGKRRRCR